MKSDKRRRKVTIREEKKSARLSHVRNPLVRAFAERLVRWRQEHGITLKTVASDLDVSISIVCEWEHGRRFPSADHFLLLARYTGIPAWGFLRGANDIGSQRTSRVKVR